MIDPKKRELIKQYMLLLLAEARKSKPKARKVTKNDAYLSGLAAAAKQMAAEEKKKAKRKAKRKAKQPRLTDTIIFTDGEGNVIDMTAPEPPLPSDPVEAQKVRDEKAKYHARCRRAFKMPPKSGGGVQ